MPTTWEAQIKAAMPIERYRRGWLLWLVWATLGTAFTLEGVRSSTQVATAFWLTIPFWIAFVAWPIIAVWRYMKDKPLVVRDIIPLATDEIALHFLIERAGITLPEPMLRDYVASTDLAWERFELPEPEIAPRPALGMPFAAWSLGTLENWANNVSELETRQPILKLQTWVRQLSHVDRMRK